MGARHRLSRTSDEAGFALVETIVSAVVLIVIALATLAAVDRAQQTSGFGKNRSVASALAEQDQARLRGLPTASLSNYRFNHASSRAVNINGLNYTVASTVDWIRDATGGTQSCTSDTSQAEYLKMTSTVSAHAIKPVTITSLDSAPLAYSSGKGTLAVKVTDGADQPVTGLNVTIAGGVSKSDATNSVGCAIFPFIPSGTYHVTYQQTGWVDESGNSAIDVTKIVNAGSTALLPLHYDRAGALTVRFETNLGTASAPQITASSGWVGSAFNTGVPGGGMRPSAFQATPQSSVALNNLYPFRTVYQTFAGQCTGTNPETAIPSATWFTTGLGLGDALIVPPGNTTGVVTVRQPALKATVKASGGAAQPGANVVLTPTDVGCTNPLIMTTDATGRATKTLTGPYDPGVPFGRYTLCAEFNYGTPLIPKWRSVTQSTALVMNDPTAVTPANLTLPGTGFGTTSSRC